MIGNVTSKSRVLVSALLLIVCGPTFAETHHVWEKVEITLQANKSYKNPYTDVQVWVDLEGPGFDRRCYGFWDGGKTFRVRVLATTPGTWTWRSGSNKSDAGLNAKTGKFTAAAWSEAEVNKNPCRRGMIKASANGHAFEYADGTPFFLLGDTWWSTPTFRFPWRDDNRRHPIGPKAGFKDYVRFRTNQGFNCFAMIVAFPNWANDGKPNRLKAKDGTILRAAWQQPGTKSAKDMHDEDGNRAFMFPGKVPGFENTFPNVDRINPAYFRNLDRKIDYLNANGAGGWDGGLWGCNVEKAAKNHIWDAMKWPSGDQTRHLAKFILSEGRKYQQLVPSRDLVRPNESGDPKGYTGWAYCARTAEKDLFLLYFEKNCPRAALSGARPNGKYSAAWFNPRTGDWSEAAILTADSSGKVSIPTFPDNSAKSKNDWALKLTRGEGAPPL